MQTDFTTLRMKLRRIEQLAQEEPFSFETQDVICKTTRDALRELDQQELKTLTNSPALKLSLMEDEKEVATI